MIPSSQLIYVACLKPLTRETSGLQQLSFSIVEEFCYGEESLPQTKGLARFAMAAAPTVVQMQIPASAVILLEKKNSFFSVLLGKSLHIDLGRVLKVTEALIQLHGYYSRSKSTHKSAGWNRSRVHQRLPLLYPS